MKILKSSADATVFKVGDTDKKSVCLVERVVELKAADGSSSIVESGSTQAKHLLSNLKPRKHTAVTKAAARIISISSDLLAQPVTNWLCQDRVFTTA